MSAKKSKKKTTKNRRKRSKIARKRGKSRSFGLEGGGLSKDDASVESNKSKSKKSEPGGAESKKEDRVDCLTLPHKEDFLLDMTNNNYSKETIYNYDRDLAVFEGFMTINNVKFRKVDKRFIMQYKGFLQSGNYLEELEGIGWERLFINSRGGRHGVGRKGKGKTGALSSRSINRMLSAFRSYLKFLVRQDLEPRPITADSVYLVKMERKKSQVAELEDLIKLVKSPTEFEKSKKVAKRNRAILELLFSTGMRISEVIKLDREQLDLSAKGLEGQGKLFISGKGKKERFVYLTPRAKFYLLEYLRTRRDPYPALFIPYRGGRNGRRGQRLSANYIQMKIAEYRRRLGIIVPTSAHSLRHGFATYLAEEGASPAAIQVLLGHESLHTTDKYVHASDKFAASSHKKFHPLYTQPQKGKTSPTPPPENVKIE